MSSGRWLGALVGIAMLMSAHPAAAVEGEQELNAVKAAEEWLALVDAGKQDESWKTASALLQRNISSEQWQTTVSGVRTPLGAVVSRERVSAIYRNELPGAPDGEYVIIQYQTSFTNKKAAIETVTPMKESDGTWRVSGYFIR